MLARPRHLLYVIIAALALALVVWLIFAAGETDAPADPDSFVPVERREAPALGALSPPPEWRT